LQKHFDRQLWVHFASEWNLFGVLFGGTV